MGFFSKMFAKEPKSHRMLLPEAVVAAAWWADALRGKHRGTSGDGGIDAALRTANAILRREPGDEVDAFAQCLAEYLTARLRGENPFAVMLRSDYGPTGELAQIVDKVRVRAPFPTKTTMWVDRGRVTVAPGYRAEEVVVYEAVAPGTCPACGQQVNIPTRALGVRVVDVHCKNGDATACPGSARVIEGTSQHTE